MSLRNVLGLIVCSAVLGGPGMAEAQDRDTQARQPQDRQAATGTVEFNDLRENADRYYGQTVTFDANVDGVLGPNAIRIGSTGFFDWFGGDMVAYAPDALGVAVSDRDQVTITGTVERYDQAQLRQHLEWIDPGQDLPDQVRESPVVRISRITTEDGRSALVREDYVQQAATGQPQDRAVGTTGAQADRDRPGKPVGTKGRIAAPITDITEAFDARRNDVGRTVHLQQVRVDRMLGNQFFLTERDGNQMLVKLPEGADRVQMGAMVGIQGVLMQMPDDVRQMPGVSQQETEQLRDNELYILATQVQPGTGQGAQPQQRPDQPPQRQPQTPQR